jgi:hypothetical protein
LAAGGGLVGVPAILEDVTDGGRDPATGDHATTSGASRTPTWLRASARAGRKVMTWFLDRIGFLTG